MDAVQPPSRLPAQHRVSFADLPQASDSVHSQPNDTSSTNYVEPPHITVPLSSIPPDVLSGSADSSPIASPVRKAKPHRDATHRSFDSGMSGNESTASATTSHLSGVTGWSKNKLAAQKAKAAGVGLRINHPRQVTGLPTKYHKALAWVGRIGWVGKAVVYAMIGGLACDSAVGNHRPDPTLPQQEQISASPQGAFVLLGATPSGVSIVILLVMMVALLAYITWRFWEGLAGQGYDEIFSAKKNFFKYRVSPLVSGAVYISYLVFIITLLDREARHMPTEHGPVKEGWPATWRHSVGGRVGLALLGVAFCIATIIQLQGVFTKQWHADYREDLPSPLMKAVFFIGHVGFAGRAGAFLAMAVLFFKDAAGVEDAPHNSSMVANALLQLQSNRGLRAVLMIIGLLLVIYGLFAVLSACTRCFPTPPPSRRMKITAAELEERAKRRREWAQQFLKSQHFPLGGRGPKASHLDKQANGTKLGSGHDAGPCTGQRDQSSADALVLHLFESHDSAGKKKQESVAVAAPAGPLAATEEVDDAPADAPAERDDHAGGFVTINLR